MTGLRVRHAVLVAWAVAAFVLVAVSLPAIAHLTFPDPDDAMRLLEVRDWLAGQSWWDVAQHRLNGGDFPMHWSRLVDLPLAAAIGMLDPVVGPPVATRLAMTVVPLATLLCLMVLLAMMLRKLTRLRSEEILLGLLIVPLSTPIVYQIRPMRIDHHGWQVVLAVAALAALLGRPSVRRGILTGAALATLVTISLEGLPVAAALTGIASLQWVADAERRHALRATLVTFFVLAVGFHAATLGPHFMVPACDAVSPAWLAMLGTAALSVSIATAAAPRQPGGRFLLLIPCAAACLIVLARTAPDCLRGPFATLDPLVRTIWYDNVREGLPMWRQTPRDAFIAIALPLVGFVGSALAWRAGDADRRRDWAVVTLALGAATLFSILVFRSDATANAFAVPGAAYLLARMMNRARAIDRPAYRLAATAGALFAASPGLAAGVAVAAAGVGRAEGSDRGSSGPMQACTGFQDIRSLAVLPAATIFAPVDVTPDLIATTHHRAIAGGYHRNARAMRRVFAAFTGSEATARPIVVGSGAGYLAICPGLNEADIYARIAPHGLWARLERGERFGWLVPVPMPGHPVRVWKVVAD